MPVYILISGAGSTAISKLLYKFQLLNFIIMILFRSIYTYCIQTNGVCLLEYNEPVYSIMII